MVWNGYLSLNGTEIANIERYEAYSAGSPSFLRTYAGDGISYALGETYTAPETDLAPWFDPDVPASGEFWGFAPAEFTGFANGSGTVSTVESTRHGGVPGRVRLGTKEVNVRGFLGGGTEEAVEYGGIWLAQALLGGFCSPLEARKQALGTDVSFFGYEPPSALDALDLDVSPQQVRDAVVRTQRRVSIQVMPQVLSQRTLSCGDFVTEVQFTLRIGDPYVYRNPKRLFDSLFGTGIVWGTEVTAGSTATTTFDETLCGNPIWEPLYDPLCAAAITPPAPPNVPLGCWDPPAEDSTHDRTVVTVPAENFPTFAEVLPVITLTATAAKRNIRIRFYPDPEEDIDLDATPCAWVSDIVVSYMPAGTLVIDSSLEMAHITTTGGNTRRADSLIFGTDQRPVIWPVLDCGTQYLVTIDKLGSDTPPSLDIDLIDRTT